ncbi:hypothetical protein HYW20_07835 [Candidatus Woesearchaeota archaeon]|nr:hypothetical protein [Candidatus Woesearchaeota archaeon]
MTLLDGFISSLPTTILGLIFLLIPLIIAYFNTKKESVSNPKRIFWKMPLIASLWAIILIILAEILFYIYIFLLGGNIHGGPIELVWLFYFPIIVALSSILSVILYFWKIKK